MKQALVTEKGQTESHGELQILHFSIVQGHYITISCVPCMYNIYFALYKIIHHKNPKASHKITYSKKSFMLSYIYTQKSFSKELEENNTGLIRS